MSTIKKLKHYEQALRDWRRKACSGVLCGPEPDPSSYELVRVEQIFVAKRLRDEIMGEKLPGVHQSLVTGDCSSSGDHLNPAA